MRTTRKATTPAITPPMTPGLGMGAGEMGAEPEPEPDVVTELWKENERVLLDDEREKEEGSMRTLAVSR